MPFGIESLPKVTQGVPANQRDVPAGDRGSFLGSLGIVMEGFQLVSGSVITVSQYMQALPRKSGACGQAGCQQPRRGFHVLSQGFSPQYYFLCNFVEDPATGGNPNMGLFYGMYFFPPPASAVFFPRTPSNAVKLCQSKNLCTGGQ